MIHRSHWRSGYGLAFAASRLNLCALVLVNFCLGFGLGLLCPSCSVGTYPPLPYSGQPFAISRALALAVFEPRLNVSSSFLAPVWEPMPAFQLASSLKLPPESKRRSARVL